MKKILTIILILLTSISFSQMIDFRPKTTIIDSDTIKIKNIDILKINLTDKYFIETSIDEKGLLIYSNKKKIFYESVDNGIVKFKTSDNLIYSLKVFKDYAELSINIDNNLKWIGIYNIDFSIMLKRKIIN